MKKTVIAEFPDDFNFPEKFVGMEKPCEDCPFFVDVNDLWPNGYTCMVNDYYGPCPFFDGAQTVKWVGVN
jgi:hypothetical protein